MRRLVGRLLLAGVLLAGAVALGPLLYDIDWQSGFRGRSSSHLTSERVGKIVNGLNRQEVTAILGLPSEDHMGSLAGSGTIEDGSRFLIWNDGRMELTVHFNPEGLVISKTNKPVLP